MHESLVAQFCFCKALNFNLCPDQNKKTQSLEEKPEPIRSVVEDWKQKFPDIKEDLFFKRLDKQL